jgi:hypothetical protein
VRTMREFLQRGGGGTPWFEGSDEAG